MTRILIRPTRRMFTRRLQWTWEIRGGNGEPIDPRETYNNRADAVQWWTEFVAGRGPVELVVYDEYGNVEKRIELRT